MPQCPSQHLIDDVRLNTQVAKPCDGHAGTGGVERGENHPPDERHAAGDFCRLLILDLTNHDDVGVLARAVGAFHDQKQSGEPDRSKQQLDEDLDDLE